MKTKSQGDWNKFLEEYKEKEKEKIDKARRQGDISRYYRGFKGKLPLIAEHRYIYPQIPFGEPLIVALHPYQFKELCGFEPTEVEELVSFAKKTNRLQFILHGEPTHYSQLDFLEPIFQELEPPIWLMDADRTIPLKEARKGIDEFSIWAKNTNFDNNFISTAVKKHGFTERFATESLYGGLGQTYALLRYYGYTDIIEYIENQFVGIWSSISYAERSRHAQAIVDTLKLCGKIIGEPLNPPFDHDRVFSLEYLGSLNNVVPSASQFTKGYKEYEVLRFLFEKLPKKTVPFPENLETCKEVIYRYEDEDLYKILEALSEEVRKRRAEEIVHKTHEVEQVLDNMWKDANKVGSWRKATRIGTEMAFTTSFSLLGGVYGLISSPGFTAVSEWLGIGNKVSKELIKKIKPYMSLIFDFKQKYNLPRDD